MDEVKYIEMGDCKTCNQPWRMTVGEHGFYVRMNHSLGGKFQIPVRCADCRARKKRYSEKLSFDRVISRVSYMAEEAQKGHYALDDEELASDLQEVHSMLRSFSKRFFESKPKILDEAEKAAPSEN